MSVSIVINNHNYGRFLEEAIRSALDQSIPALEVIVVDDGSTDDSRAVMASFGDRIQSIFQANGGQAAAFNTGIAAAKGDWVWLLDADDSLKPDALANAQRLIGPGISRIAMGMEFIDADGKSIGKQVPNGGRSFTGNLRDALLVEGELPCTPTSGNLFSSAALQAVLPVPEQMFRICADAYLFIMSARHGLVKQEPVLVANYRIHGANHYASRDEEAIDPVVVGRKLNGVLLVMNLLEDYGRTLSALDARKIRRFWFTDQVLPVLLRAKLARASHPILADFGLPRLVLAIICSILPGPRPLRVRLWKFHHLMKLLLKYGRMVVS